MQARMVKSPAEIALIREGARIADVGGYAIRDAIAAGAREIDIAMAGRDAMELEIARSFPDSEIRDTWVWFQSGLNTDGARNPVNTRALEIDTVLEPGMVVSMEPMLWIPEGTRGAGGYREHDILVVNKDGAENITGFPYGPDHNIID